MNAFDKSFLTENIKLIAGTDEVGRGPLAGPVVAAACINDMKTDMSENEFRAVVIALSKAFQGGTIDEKIFNLKYWKR